MPAGTPPEVVGKVNAALNEALADPAVRDRITAQGAVVGGGTAAGDAILVTPGRCEPPKPPRPEHVKARGAITAVSVTTAIIARSTNPGMVQAHVFLIFAALIALMLPLVKLVPDHHGTW